MINLQRVLDRKSQQEPPLPVNGPPSCRLVLQVTGCIPPQCICRLHVCVFLTCCIPTVQALKVNFFNTSADPR